MFNEVRTISRADLIVLILAIAFAVFCYFIPFISSTFGYVLVGFVHEFGHAVAAFLSGRVSIPIYFFFARTFDFSWWTVLFVWLSMVMLLIIAWRKKYYIYTSFLGCSLFSSLILVSIPEKYSGLFITFHGIGGEITFAMFFIIAYFLNLPARLQNARLFLLTLGIYIYISNIALWFKVLKDSSKLPLGSLMFGPDHGDMNKLLAAGFSTDNIVLLYLAWTTLSFFIISIFFLCVALFSSKRIAIA